MLLLQTWSASDQNEPPRALETGRSRVMEQGCAKQARVAAGGPCSAATGQRLHASRRMPGGQRVQLLRLGLGQGSCAGGKDLLEAFNWLHIAVDAQHVHGTGCQRKGSGVGSHRISGWFRGSVPPEAIAQVEEVLDQIGGTLCLLVIDVHDGAAALDGFSGSLQHGGFVPPTASLMKSTRSN